MQDGRFRYGMCKGPETEMHWPVLDQGSQPGKILPPAGHWQYLERFLSQLGGWGGVRYLFPVGQSQDAPQYLTMYKSSPIAKNNLVPNVSSAKIGNVRAGGIEGKPSVSVKVKTFPSS